MNPILNLSAFIILLSSKSDYKILAYIFGIVIVLAILNYLFSRRTIVLRKFRGYNEKRISDFSDGDTGKIIGNVVFAGKIIYAPLSKRKCVLYHIIVQEYSSGGVHGIPDWVQIIEEEEKADIVITDGKGYAIVDAAHSMTYLVPDKNYETTICEVMTPELKSILERHRAKSYLDSDKKICFIEGVLEEGEMFAVAGEGHWRSTKDFNLNIPSSRILHIVPHQKVKVLVSDDKKATAVQQE